MNTTLKIRKMLCNKTDGDISKALHKKGFEMSATKVSQVINGYVTYPKAKRALELIEEILTDWEKEQGRVWDGTSLGL